MRISDWSSDVCSSDLGRGRGASASRDRADADEREQRRQQGRESIAHLFLPAACRSEPAFARSPIPPPSRDSGNDMPTFGRAAARSSSIPISKSLSYRSEEHTSELQSLMRISYAVFCLKKKNN